MTYPLVYIGQVPTMGACGQRDNVDVLVQLTRDEMPPGTVIDVTIGHDSACPCAGGAAATCLCERVNLTLQARDGITI